jgi:hypothetical protein
MYEVQEDFFVLILQYNSTIRRIYVSVRNGLYFGICWVIPVAYHTQSTSVFEHGFQEIWLTYKKNTYFARV